jgi:hypothetical protein
LEHTLTVTAYYPERHSKYAHVFAIVRFDLPITDSNLEQRTSVVKVLPTQTSAESEALRLNELNDAEGCKYVVYLTRLISDVAPEVPE